MQSDIDPRTLIGHRAVDRNGTKIGTVDEVYLDDATGAPEWAAVRTGMFGHDALVPLTASRVADGDLYVPYDRDMVKDAPDIGAGQHISPEQEMQLYRYYGVEVEGEPAPRDSDFGRVAGERADDGADTRETAGAAGPAGAAEAAGTAGTSEMQSPADRIAEERSLQDASLEEPGAGTAAAAAAGTAAGGARFVSAPSGTVYPAEAPDLAASDAATDDGSDAAGAPMPAAAMPTAGMPSTDMPSAGAPASDAPSGTPFTEMTRHEEELHVDTERTVVGRARVRRFVVVEEVERTVPVLRQQARVVREPLTGEEAAELSEAELAEAVEEVELYAETPVVRTVARPVERLRLVVEEVRGEETVRGEVRKERFEVEDAGVADDGVTGNPAGSP